MEAIMQGWLSIWLYVMLAIGIVLGACVWKNRKTWSALNILCTLAIIVLILHVIEEWVLPGGLHYSYNIAHGSTLLSRYPMNRLTDMITNFGAVVVGCIVLKVWGFCKPAGVAVMLFSAFEVVMHISIGIQDMGIFGKYGMNTLYSPGLITSLFGSENTPYEFTDRGYYEQYGEQYEQDNGYEYFEPEAIKEEQ